MTKKELIDSLEIAIEDLENQVGAGIWQEDALETTISVLKQRLWELTELELPPKEGERNMWVLDLEYNKKKEKDND